MIIFVIQLVLRDTAPTPNPINALFVPSTASAVVLQEIVSPATTLTISESSTQPQKGAFLLLGTSKVESQFLRYVLLRALHALLSAFA